MAIWETRIRVMVSVMILVTLGVCAAAVTALYQTAFQQERGRLLEIAQSQAMLIDAVARFDREQSADFPGGGVAATISQIRDAHSSYKAFGKTGEFLVASMKDGRIVYLMSHRGERIDDSLPLAADSGVDDTMMLALSGRSGSRTTIDHGGNAVLAAYSPIAELKLGIVVKVDLAELRAPFIRATLFVLPICLGLIVLGTMVFRKAIGPIIVDLLEKNAELKHMIGLRNALEAMSRHDLKGPLGSIIGLPDLLLGAGYIREEDREILHAIKEGGRRMLDMVDSSLRMVQMENGTYALCIYSVDMVSLVKKVFGDLHKQALNRSVDLNLMVRDRPPRKDEKLMFQTDDAVMYSILSNLVKNAVEAAPESTNVVVALEPDDSLIIRIHNDGEVHEMIRDRFFEKYATYGKDGGTGIGTYTARLMARALGGDICLKTSARAGTTLVVTLPPPTVPTATA